MRFRHLVFGIASLSAFVSCGCSGVHQGRRHNRSSDRSERHFRFQDSLRAELLGLPRPGRKRWSCHRSCRSGVPRGCRRRSGSARGGEWNRRDGYACVRAKRWRNAHQQTDRFDRQRHSRTLVEAGCFAGRESASVLFIRAWQSFARIGSVRQLLFFLSWCGGRGGEKASSIVNGSFLALLNDQELRTIVIVGRPELGAP